MIMIYKSKFTPKITAEETYFQKGTKVRYRMESGMELDIIIDSDKMQHDSGLFGYEAIFTDDNRKYFASEKGIINWEGKC